MTDLEIGIVVSGPRVDSTVSPADAPKDAYMDAIKAIANAAFENTDATLQDVEDAVKEALGTYLYKEGEKDYWGK